MDNLDKEIGAKICSLRENLGLTREKLGSLANISERFIYDIETGRKGISAESLYKLSKSLNVSSDYLLFSKEKKTNLDYIIEILSNFDEHDIKSVEKILIELSRALHRKENEVK